MELQGQIALVTGGSRGIGAAIAHALAAGGARVAVVGRDSARALDTAAQLPGEGHRGWGCDVSAAEEVQALVQEVEEAMGGVTILVNNAGITRDNLLMRLQEADWDEVLDTNLKGAFLLTRGLSRGMMKRRDGVIVHISSVVGISGNAGQANYAASKAGLIGFSKSVARELASRGIRSNVVAPGYIATDMTAALDEKQTEALRSAIPLGRFGSPEDIAGVVRFLAGPSARYITGQVITVDGGMVI